MKPKVFFEALVVVVTLFTIFSLFLERKVYSTQFEAYKVYKANHVKRGERFFNKTIEFQLRNLPEDGKVKWNGNNAEAKVTQTFPDGTKFFYVGTDNYSCNMVIFPEGTGGVTLEFDGVQQEIKFATFNCKIEN